MKNKKAACVGARSGFISTNSKKKFLRLMQPTKFFASDQAPKGSTLLQTFLHRAISAELQSGLDAVKYLYRNHLISKKFAFELAIYCLRRVGRGKGFCAMQISQMVNQKESVNA